jgi:hypothetical protein
VLIAVGIVAVLGGMSLMLQLFSISDLRKKVARRQKSESFYVGELAAWHQYLRKMDGLAPVNGADAKGRNQALIIPADISGLPEDSDPTSPSLSIATTSKYGSMNLFSYTSDKVLYRAPSSTTYCGETSFQKGKKAFKNCLSEKSAAAPSTKRGPRLLASGWESICAIVTGGAVMCWGENEALGIGNPAEGDSKKRYVPAPTLITSGAVSVAGGARCAPLFPIT